MTTKAKDQPSTDCVGMLSKMPFNPLNDRQLKIWSDLGAEVMQFAASRIQRDIEAQKAMLACKSREDLQKLQVQYYSEAVKDYSAQIQSAMEVISGAADKLKDDVVTSTKRGYDDMPL